ncbi:MAG TPA: hypothetical protein VH413_08005 [Verrucomicrobiae bacterium]|nr:hypothetical protein [Verrucomicrobiae bacterium]
MRKLLLFVLAALAAGGCATRPVAKPIAAQPLAPPAPYTRVANPDTNTVQLQIALRKFVPAHQRGPAIWLAGTMHVGEPAYYHEVQKFLDKQTVVLYEGVNTGSHKNHVPGAKVDIKTESSPPPEMSSTNAGFSMQSQLARSLGLVFQLDVIDYDRTNFLNSDLSILQIQRLMLDDPTAELAQPGEPTRSNPTFDALLQIMDGSSFLGSMFKMGIQFIGANPKLQALTKLTLIEAVGQLKGDFSSLRGVPPDLKKLLDVLIQARNENVIKDLKTEVKLVPKKGSIAVFYGTGHMDDMEKRLTSELDYRPTDDIWLTAFAVDMRTADVSPGEVQMMRNLVKWQMGEMQQ